MELRGGICWLEKVWVAQSKNRTVYVFVEYVGRGFLRARRGGAGKGAEAGQTGGSNPRSTGRKDVEGERGEV